MVGPDASRRGAAETHDGPFSHRHRDTMPTGCCLKGPTMTFRSVRSSNPLDLRARTLPFFAHVDQATEAVLLQDPDKTLKVDGLPEETRRTLRSRRMGTETRYTARPNRDLDADRKRLYEEQDKALLHRPSLEELINDPRYR